MLISNINVLTAKDRKKFKLTIRKYTIHEVDQFKYLGVILDNKFSWNHHINYLVTKLSQVAGILYKVRCLLPLKSRILIYNSLAGSYLNYGILAWGSATQTSLHKIKTLQNRIIIQGVFFEGVVIVFWIKIDILKVTLHSTHHK